VGITFYGKASRSVTMAIVSMQMPARMPVRAHFVEMEFCRTGWRPVMMGISWTRTTAESIANAHAVVMAWSRKTLRRVTMATRMRTMAAAIIVPEISVEMGYATPL